MPNSKIMKNIIFCYQATNLKIWWNNEETFLTNWDWQISPLNEEIFQLLNTLRPRQNGCHFADDIFKWIFLNENVWILIKISLKFVPQGPINTLRPRQNGRRFADDTFKCIFLNENVWIPIKISLKFVLKGRINNIPALVQIMAWRRPGDKTLSEPMMVSLTTHICVTRPQWVNNIPTLVQIMAWCRPSDKPLSGPMMVRLPTHICVTRLQWVKTDWCICVHQ